MSRLHRLELNRSPSQTNKEGKYEYVDKELDNCFRSGLEKLIEGVNGDMPFVLEDNVCADETQPNK